MASIVIHFYRVSVYAADIHALSNRENTDFLNVDMTGLLMDPANSLGEIFHLQRCESGKTFFGREPRLPV
jgi:hypothetical protein